MIRSLIVSVSLLIAFQAPAQTIPTEFQGIWAEGSCNDPKSSFLVNNSFAMVFRTGADGQDQMAIGPVSWSGDRIVMEIEQFEIPFPDPSGLASCEMLPARHYLGLGETIAFIAALDELSSLCSETPSSACLTSAFAALDVSSDDELSVAELARGTRAASTFLAYGPDLETPLSKGRDVTLDDLLVPMSDLVPGAITTLAVGPLLIGNLINSYDYDGDGFLSMEEIAQDRAGFLQNVVSTATEQTAAASAKSTAAVAISEIVEKTNMLMALMYGFLYSAEQSPDDN